MTSRAKVLAQLREAHDDVLSAREELRQAMERRQEVVQRARAAGMSIRELGAVIGVSYESIRRAERQATTEVAT